MKRFMIFVTGLILSSKLMLFAQNLETGIWAGKNTELVRTNNYCILFIHNQDSTITASAFQYKSTPAGISCSFYGEVTMNDSMVVKKQLLFNADTTMPLSTIGETIENKMNLTINDKVHHLVKIENIDIVEPYEMFFAQKENIGQCLQQWNLGTDFYTNPTKKRIRLTIGTNRHMYVFSVNPETIYCRAARIRSNNLGSLFAQNIRLWQGNGSHNAYFKRKNDSVSAARLKIDNELFRPDACTFDDAGIYWSLSKQSKRKIVINGCGQTYVYHRIPVRSARLEEWIRFENY